MICFGDIAMFSKKGVKSSLTKMNETREDDLYNHLLITIAC